MFSLFGKKEEQVKPQGDTTAMLAELRETLFTRSSLEPVLARLGEQAKSAFPWSNFAAADRASKDGDKAAAIAQLKQIHEAKGLDTRIRLQCWHTLVSWGE